MGGFPADFLAKYIEENVGPLGALGRFPLGIASYAAGIPGLTPNGVEEREANPALFGGLAGLGISSLS
jgi:hypothetical protein